MDFSKVAWVADHHGEDVHRHGMIWAQCAVKTGPIDSGQIVSAVEALYEASGLKKPRVVVASSPGVMAFAGTFASAVWDKRKSDPLFEACCDPMACSTEIESVAARVVLDATRGTSAILESYDVGSALLEAAYTPSDLGTVDSLPLERWSAIREGLEAFDALVYADYCIRETMRDPFGNENLTEFMDEAAVAWGSALAAKIFPERDDGRLAMARVHGWWQQSQASSAALYWTSCIAAARDLDGLKLPAHKSFVPWEQCALLSFYRYVHPEFCIVCDFPEEIDTETIVSSYHVRNRPLDEARQSPSFVWPDGWCF